MFQGMGKEKLSDAEFEYVITSVDADGSGFVHVEEYIAWATS